MIAAAALAAAGQRDGLRHRRQRHGRKERTGELRHVLRMGHDERRPLVERLLRRVDDARREEHDADGTGRGEADRHVPGRLRGTAAADDPGRNVGALPHVADHRGNVVEVLRDAVGRHVDERDRIALRGEGQPRARHRKAGPALGRHRAVFPDAEAAGAAGQRNDVGGRRIRFHVQYPLHGAARWQVDDGRGHLGGRGCRKHRAGQRDSASPDGHDSPRLRRASSAYRSSIKAAP